MGSSVSFVHVVRAEQRHPAVEFLQFGRGERFIELGWIWAVSHDG